MRSRWAVWILAGSVGCADAPAEAAHHWCAPTPEVVVAGYDGDGAPLDLTEVWRTGSDVDEPLTQPNAPAVSRDGRVAIPDPSVSAVMVVDADGTWLGNVVTKGKGPGEVTWPVEVAWTSSGNLLVFDLANGKVIELDLQSDSIASEYLLDRALYGRIARYGQVGAGDLSGDRSVYLELPPEPISDRPGYSWVTAIRMNAGPRIDTLFRAAVEMIESDGIGEWKRPGAPYPRFAASVEGVMAVGGGTGVYRVVVKTPALIDSIALCRDVEPSTMTSAEQGDFDWDEDAGTWQLELSDALRGAPPLEEVAPFGALFFGERGRLWVLRDRPDPSQWMRPPEGGTYDVFAEGGSYLGWVKAPSRTELIGEARGQVYGLARGTLDEIELVAFQLTPASSGK